MKQEASLSSQSSAPALTRGIKLLDLLRNDCSLSLEELSRRLDAPKSSVLRITGALEELGLISRDREDKTYRALYALTPVGPEGVPLTETVRRHGERLCADSACTVEWYVFNSRLRSFQITQRFEPRDVPVLVRARVGFLRRLDVELEAVTTLGLALGLGRLHRDNPLWVRRDGVRENVFMDHKDAQAHVDASARSLFARDFGFNEKGVYRMAAALTDGKGSLLGILALAHSYTPQAAEKLEKSALLLKETVRSMENQIAGPA